MEQAPMPSLARLLTPAPFSLSQISSLLVLPASNWRACNGEPLCKSSTYEKGPSSLLGMQSSKTIGNLERFKSMAGTNTSGAPPERPLVKRPSNGRGGSSRNGGRWCHSNRGGERAVRRRVSSDEYRYWLHAVQKPSLAHEKFILVSYNILAVDNVRQHWRELYYHIPSHFMKWGTRKWKLLQEINLWSPDILCLQEVDRFDDLNEELQKRGYTGVYKGRTGKANDGCAIFWRQRRFKLLQEESIEFRELDLRDNVAQLCVLQSTNGNCKSNEHEEIQPEKSGANKCVVVGNIHVLFNPKRGDIKLGQVRVLLDRANTLSQDWGGAPVAIAGDFNSTPTSALYHYVATSELDVADLDRRLISGQYDDGEGNGHVACESSGLPASEANRWRSCSQSSPIDALVAGEELAGSDVPSIVSVETEACTVAIDGKEGLATYVRETSTVSVFSSLEGRDLDVSCQLEGSVVDVLVPPERPWSWTPDELKAATGSEQDTTLRHNLKLQSAYSEIEGKAGSRDDMGEPLVTTYHRKFMGTVDYIWHTEGLSTVRVLDTLPLDILQRTQGLPSQKWGSDHLALACELSFVSDHDHLEQTGGLADAADTPACSKAD